MWLVVDVPVLPAAAGVEKVAARDEVGVTVAVDQVKALPVAIELAIFALFG